MSDLVERLRKSCPQNDSECCAERDHGADQIKLLTARIEELEAKVEIDKITMENFLTRFRAEVPWVRPGEEVDAYIKRLNE